MWSSRLFWKLFISYAVLNLTATATFVVIVSGWQQDQVIEQITQRLYDSAALVRSDVLDLLPQGRTEQLQARVRQLGDEISTRITLVALNGEVLADSRRTSASVVEMENHQNRLELVQAATMGRGTSERTSATLGEPMLYAALRADDAGQPVGLVRTALPMNEVRAHVAAIQRLIWGVGAMVSIAVLALTHFVVARMVRPVSILTDAAEAIAAGNYQHRVHLRTDDEFGTLARSFNSMSDQLAAREDELRESSQRLATVLEGMVEGVIALDDSQRVVLANSAAGRLLGFSPIEAEGRSLLEVVRNHALHEALAKSDVTQESESVEIELSGDGNRLLLVNITSLSGESTARCILVLHDVTDLRRLESVRQEFSANVSHELKTPLSSIKAYAETLLGGAINDQENNVRFVERIGEQAERLNELIMDMLSLARIESGQQAFEIGAVNLAETVHACVAQHQTLADAKGVRLASDGDDPGLLVQADEEAVRQILNNLIDNAVKYTPEHGTVTVAWRPEDSMAVLEVRDTGTGIAAEFLPRVFERFFRVDKARSRELGGTGLGLAIVRHLANSFGGAAEVESRPGEGSVFRVKLPRVGTAGV